MTKKGKEDVMKEGDGGGRGVKRKVCWMKGEEVRRGERDSTE